MIPSHPPFLLLAGRRRGGKKKGPSRPAFTSPVTIEEPLDYRKREKKPGSPSSTLSGVSPSLPPPPIARDNKKHHDDDGVSEPSEQASKVRRRRREVPSAVRSLYYIGGGRGSVPKQAGNYY